MASVDDIAAAILERTGPISTMKLQKLVYYCQAWHAVWDDEILFNAPIEAWANGPVCRQLYNRHRRDFAVSRWAEGDPSQLLPNEIETIDAVVQAYGKLPAHELSALTHRERPWRDARRGLDPGERGNNVITVAAMVDYYSSLDTGDGVDLV